MGRHLVRVIKTLVELCRAVNAEIKIIVTPKEAKISGWLYQQEWFELLQSFDFFNNDDNVAHDETTSQESYSHKGKNPKPVAA